ncbi:MAG: tyrosine-type recombinase/integrase [Candidatus Daviesbacteria bacterium]|nr:tyrosine-type recombinase/integrase [Candidatus Daviesbacteria bacterium]
MDDAIKYIMGFYNTNKSYSHIVNTCLALERYSKFIVGTPIKLGRPKKPRRIITGTLQETEIARMFAFCKNTRQKAILGVLAYTGIRNLELTRLKVGNIDFRASTVFIQGGKGHKDGLVFISPACLIVVREYLQEYPRKDEETLFTSIARNRKDDALHTDAVRKTIKKIAKRAGIKRRVWPHLFRHSLAMNMLAKGSDIYSIREQLRHSYIDTTLIYVHSSPQVMQNRYQIFCPNYIWEAKMDSLVMDGPQHRKYPAKQYIAQQEVSY